MNINSSLMESAASLGSRGNPVTSSYETCPDSPASFCTRHSSSTAGPAPVLSMAPVTSSNVRRRPRSQLLPAGMGTFVFFDRLHDDGSAALPASKQNQCWSVSHVPFTANYNGHKTKPCASNPAAQPPGTNLTIKTTHCSKQNEKNMQSSMQT